MKMKLFAVLISFVAAVAVAENKPADTKPAPAATTSDKAADSTAKDADKHADEKAGDKHADEKDAHAGHGHGDEAKLPPGSSFPPLKANTNKIVLTNLYMAASYIMGIQDAGNIFMQDFQNYIDPEIFIAGFRDVFGHYKPLIPLDQADDILKDFEKQMQRLDAEKNIRMAETNKIRGKEFLEANQKKEGVITTPTGLQYKVIKEGSGATPNLDDKVAVHFRGKTIDGMEFSSSYKHKQPTVVPLRYQIDGWKEALQMMKEGSKWEVFVPSALAYKDREVGRGVGGNSTLIFELELVRVEKTKPGQVTP